MKSIHKSIIHPMMSRRCRNMMSHQPFTTTTTTTTTGSSVLRLSNCHSCYNDNYYRNNNNQSITTTTTILMTHVSQPPPRSVDMYYHTSQYTHQQQQPPPAPAAAPPTQSPPSLNPSLPPIVDLSTTTATLTASSSIPPPPVPPVPPKKYESYEYPWATEPPTITRMTATEAAEQAIVNAANAAAAAAAAANTAETTTVMGTNESNDTTANNESSSASASSSSSSSIGSLWTTITTFVSNLLSPSSNNTTTTSLASTNTSSMSSFASIAADAVSSVKSSLRQLQNNDPFDDRRTMTPTEIEQIRTQQRLELSQLSTTLEPVTTTVPSYVPIASSKQERPIPETIITELTNGMRIVSQETYGHVSTIGIVSTMGSRYETSNSSGVTNMMELLAYGTTDVYNDNQHVSQQLQQWLGTRFVHSGREQSMYGIDVLRPNVTQACDMLSQIILHPHFTPIEIAQAKENLNFYLTHEDLSQEFIMSEAINTAAFGTDQQLGQPHGCPISQIPILDRTTIDTWWQHHMINNPKGLVFGGAGIDHDTLVKLGEQYFGHLQQRQPPDHDPTTTTNKYISPIVPSKYRGGCKIVTLPTPIDGGDDLSPEQYSIVHREKRLTRVAVGIEIGGWHSNNLVPICVLQALLGGGSSFSAGGPGKGMYSRLYRQVLNRYHWAESAESYTAFHSEAGLMGISGRVDGKHATDMVKAFCMHLKRLAVEPVTEEELDRARNMLRNEVMTQLESRFVLFEDMSRQVLTYGKREPIHETVMKIDAVTAEQIQQIIAQAIHQPPTFTAVGVDVQNVPTYEQVCEWLQR